MEGGMTLDHDLLEKARLSAAALAEAERLALLSRAEYHTAIRRLHLGGGSLREIAQQLSLSHQRVQQIVDGAGGSWWRRMWRTRSAARDAVCTWCTQPPSEVSKLVAGPNVYICDTCIGNAERAMRGSDVHGRSALRRAARGARTRCSFCSKRGSERRSLVASRDGNICSECLAICRELADGRRS
jgi:hypothetical protein